ncbi:unnamed protein product [Brassicogethes aeneus]|uniref:Cytochrome P450 n=1 Tax=Brassicogethes aeneus TaxID=1431903 RepID=A0A9P0AYT9_BRAAE|nr:unnamed protein product [Brassicogethes aeneus]
MLDLILVAWLSICAFYLWSDRRRIYLSFKIPGPTISETVNMLINTKLEDIYQEALNLYGKFPKICKIWTGPKLFVVVNDADNLHKILTSPSLSNKKFPYDFLRTIYGDGLITSSGLKHTIQRKQADPMFTLKAVEGYYSKLTKHTNVFIEKMGSKVDGPSFEVMDYLSEHLCNQTLDIIVGIDNNFENVQLEAPFTYELIKQIVHYFALRLQNFLHYPDFIYKLTKNYSEVIKLKEISNRWYSVLRKEKLPPILEKLKREKLTGVEEEDETMYERMIRNHMAYPKQLTEKDIEHQIYTLIAANQDTTVIATTMAVMMLGTHPKIQEKALNEIQSVVGDSSDITISDVHKFIYLEMCIKETLRLFPGAVYITRYVQTEFNLDEWVIPADCTLVLSIIKPHLSEEHWEKPKEFYPEHFLPEATSKRHPNAYFPFSLGPRRCIATTYAFVNMKLLLARILQNYLITSDLKFSELKFQYRISVTCTSGHMIKLTSRKRQ